MLRLWALLRLLLRARLSLLHWRRTISVVLSHAFDEAAAALGRKLVATVSVGTDVVFVPEVAMALATHGARYAQRVYTAAERDYAEGAVGAAERAQRYAARFAAKEAVIKALGLAQIGTNWHDIEVTRQTDGSIGITLHGEAARIAEQRGVRCKVSLTHCHDYAAALVAAVPETTL